MLGFTPGRDINAVYEFRKFSRFFTSFLGITGPRIPHTDYSLQDARILYEIGHQEDCTATVICSALSMDSGYLSRRISRFTRQELVVRTCSAEDNRVFFLRLTAEGARVLQSLEDACSESVSRRLDGISDADRTLLIQCMDTIESVLTRASKKDEP